jgi:hypothetical protein
MANTFKRYIATASTVGVTLYTVSSISSVVIGINAANTTGTQQTISVQLNAFYLIKDAAVPAGSALSLLDGKLVLENADAITITSSADTSIDVVLSAMEKT